MLNYEELILLSYWKCVLDAFALPAWMAFLSECCNRLKCSSL